MPLAPTYHFGTLPLVTRGPSKARGKKGQLDSLSFEILVHRDAIVSELAYLGFTENQRYAPGGYSMWMEPWSEEEETDLTSIVTFQCIGLLSSGEKRTRKMSVAGREVAVGPNERFVLAWSADEKGTNEDGSAVDNVKRRVPKLDSAGEPVLKTITTPAGVGKRWNVREAIVIITDTYFVTSRPDMSLAGRNLTPPNAPTPPAYIWGNYSEPMRLNSPNGWVLDDRAVQEHFYVSNTDGLWEVTDTIGYYYLGAPD